MRIQIFHNPRCSKSRATLALLQERGLTPTVVEYLKTPPTVAELAEILRKLDRQPRDILRKSEAAYEASGAADPQLSRKELLEIMVAHPVLIERPIVVAGERAAIGRPPEAVTAILPA